VEQRGISLLVNNITKALRRMLGVKWHHYVGNGVLFRDKRVPTITEMIHTILKSIQGSLTGAFNPPGQTSCHVSGSTSSMDPRP